MPRVKSKEPPVSVVCPSCAVPFLITAGNYRFKLKRSSTKRLYCSIDCVGVSLRGKRGQRDLVNSYLERIAK